MLKKTDENVKNGRKRKKIDKNVKKMNENVKKNGRERKKMDVNVKRLTKT